MNNIGPTRPLRGKKYIISLEFQTHQSVTEANVARLMNKYVYMIGCYLEKQILHC